MPRFLACVDAVPGRLYPLVSTLLELAHRGHHVIVKAGIALRSSRAALAPDAACFASPLASGWLSAARPDRR